MTDSEIIKKTSKIIDFLNRLSSERPIALHEPYFYDTNAMEYARDCIESGWVSSAGKWVERFEMELIDFTRAENAIAVTNGTVALRLALHLVGVRSNDEVIVPPMSFVASANAVSHLGADPHFVDIESKTLGLCPNALKNRLDAIAVKKGKYIFNKETGKRIKAIVVVHVFGIPANIFSLKKIADEWNLPLIEDAAEALGSWVINKEKKKTHCGLIGDIGIISFNGNKVITTGGGGALITNNEIFATKAKHLSSTAKVQHQWEFFHDEVGWNDRMPNINAALGVAQLEVLEKRLNLKRELFKKYQDFFSKLSGFDLIREEENTKSNYWLITMRLLTNNQNELIELRDQILRNAHEKKILLRPVWHLLNKLIIYKNKPSAKTTVAENESMRLINLPSNPNLLQK